MTGTEVFLIVVVIGLFFGPSILAFKYNHRLRVTILITNIMFGWIPPVWVFLMVWMGWSMIFQGKSFIGRSTTIVNNMPGTSNIDQLSKLNDLRNSGVITDEEFNFQKTKLLS